MSGVPKTWLIVGASRGIGHEFVRQLVDGGQNVLATVRDANAVTARQVWSGADDNRVKLFSCDMLSDQSITVRSLCSNERVIDLIA